MNLKNIPSSLVFYFLGRYTSNLLLKLVLRTDKEEKEIEKMLNKKYGFPSKYSKLEPSRNFKLNL
jgi:hypothetical protein